MNLLKQFESFTPEEIKVIYDLLNRTLEFSYIKQKEWIEYISSFNGFDTGALFDKDFLPNQTKELENYKIRVKELEVILNKIKPLKELVNNE